MVTRFAHFLFILAISANLATAAQKPASPAQAATAGGAAKASAGTTPASTTPAPAKSGRTVVDQTAQVIIFCYHRLVDKIRYPGTEIRPVDFEAEMKALKDHGITVIGMQDFLAWRRGEKNIAPRSAVRTCAGGWKWQYENAW